MNRFGFLALLGAMAAGANAQFSIGNLVVLRTGDGTAALSGVGTAMFIDQFTTAGAAVSSTAIDTTGSNIMTMSGSATAEGGLSIVYFGGNDTLASNWGVAFGGYNAALGTAGVAATTSAANPRRGGLLRFNSPSGTYSTVDLTNATANPFSGGGIRGVAFDGVNNKFAAVGSNSGVFEAPSTGSGALVSTTNTNNRRAQIAGNDIYFSAGGGTRGIWETPGGMGGGTITSVLLQSAAATSSINDFQISRSLAGVPTSIIFADDVSAAAGGLYFNNAWDGTANSGIGGFTGSATQIVSGTAIGTALGLTVTGLRDIAVIGTDVYATTAEAGVNHIVKVSFASGFLAGNTGISVVATSGTNTAFRGLEVVPEPTSVAVLGLGMVGLMARRRRKNS